MNEIEEMQELSELKALIEEHSVDYDYPEVFRMLEKITSIINEKHELIQEKYRLQEYALHCCKEANKTHLKELNKLKGKPIYE